MTFNYCDFWFERQDWITQHQSLLLGDTCACLSNQKSVPAKQVKLYIPSFLHLYISFRIIGANLNEPRTCMTVLCTHISMVACLVGPTTYHKFQKSSFKYFMKIDIVNHVKASGSSPTEVEAHMATLFWFVFLSTTTTHVQVCHQNLLST